MSFRSPLSLVARVLPQIFMNIGFTVFSKLLVHPHYGITGHTQKFGSAEIKYTALRAPTTCSYVIKFSYMASFTRGGFLFSAFEKSYIYHIRHSFFIQYFQ